MFNIIRGYTTVQNNPPYSTFGGQEHFINWGTHNKFDIINSFEYVETENIHIVFVTYEAYEYFDNYFYDNNCQYGIKSKICIGDCEVNFENDSIITRVREKYRTMLSEKKINKNSVLSILLLKNYDSLGEYSTLESIKISEEFTHITINLDFFSNLQRIYMPHNCTSVTFISSTSNSFSGCLIYDSKPDNIEVIGVACCNVLCGNYLTTNKEINNKKHIVDIKYAIQLFFAYTHKMRLIVEKYCPTITKKGINPPKMTVEQVSLMLQEIEQKKIEAILLERKEEEKMRSKKEEEYQNALKVLSEMRSDLINLGSSYHYIISSEDLLVHYQDHLVIKNKYRLSLSAFNLSLINWTNVDIRGINFTGSRDANIIPSQVYLKDCTGTNFTDVIFSPFVEFQFDDVILDNAIISNPHGILSFEKARSYKNIIITEFKQKLIK